MNGTDQELHRLFVGKADGTITSEDHERLTELLQESADIRGRWFAFHDAESALLAWSQREALRREEGVGIEVVGPNPAASASRSGGRLRYVGTLAAGIVIGLVTWGPNRRRGFRQRSWFTKRLRPRAWRCWPAA